MKLNLCEFLGVEEDEKFELIFTEKSYTSRVHNNKLEYYNYIKNEWFLHNTSMYSLLCSEFKIEKLPNKTPNKNFSYEELILLETLNKEYKWIARDKCGVLYVYQQKPYKESNSWFARCNYKNFPYEHRFKSISWEDEEPVYIDDYVER